MSEAVTIWHNPACGTSRNTLAMIRAAGVEPTVVEYLKTPPTRDELAKAISDAGLSPREAAREKGTPFAALGLGQPGVTDDGILDAMLAHPILINRPFVFTSRGVRLCRPSEAVLEILPTPLADDFTKEDGEVVASGRGAG
ncbi:arsenate reductase [Methylopila capsulata]|uniref:Arsenate reductase n=1 Tax=Methylopila capsulata TaxID=61654 RepID=A0A9W6IWI9_9HYPH|nr:arsenate reductase (glutaredoxin) [Methylopila capsulata]MBM7852676.1 arsenate reductase [Methylopila capsulata]GLK56884.1 arsenate reductase [Methylopila capsulata]